MKNYVKGYVHIPTGSNISFRETWLDVGDGLGGCSG